MAGIARWKELCMDTTDGEALGRFWADVAGLRFEPDGGGPGDLVGPTEGHGIAMCRVPEPKTVKHRVHLDVETSALDDLTAKGATVVLPAAESGFRWTVMADPEGGEFCAFVREPDQVPDYTVLALVVDCADSAATARWWADVFGAEAEGTGDQGWWRLKDVPGMPIREMLFIPVPEPKSVKNRIHWDVYSEVEALREKGATVLRPRDDDPSTGSGQRISWTVMADPEGNEFCVFDG